MKGWVVVVMGVAVSAVLVWMTMFATPGFVEVATLLVGIGALIWFATVDPERLVDARRRPDTLLFTMVAVGFALVIAGVRFIGSGTILLLVVVAATTVIVGLGRAVWWGIQERN